MRNMPSKFKYLEGEKVLCYHGPLLYEAKVNTVVVHWHSLSCLIIYTLGNEESDER